MKVNFFIEDIVVTEDRFNVVKDLINSLPLNKKRIDAATRATSIELVVANLVYHEGSVLIEHFSNRYKVSSYRSYKTERRVIKLLKMLGYVDYYKALSNKALKDLEDSGQDVSMHKENGKNKRSRMWLTEKGREYFAHVSADLRLVTRRKKRKGAKKNKKEYDYFPFQEDELAVVEKYENLLVNLNEIMSQHQLHYVDAKTGEIEEFQNDARIIFSGDDSNKIHTSLRRGGRYVSNVAYMWRHNRKSVTIDGKRTVEIDLSCSLPSIMFGKFGVGLSALENDLYHVPGEENCEYMRDLAKTIVVTMLGVTSEYTLKESVKKKFNRFHNGETDVDGHPIERFFPQGFEIEDINRVIGKILKRYRTLCPKVDNILFKKDLATNILQGIEARIATAIINTFVQKGKPILCIHDSFRVLEEDEELLTKLMNEAYFAEVGMPPLGLKVDRQIATEVEQPVLDPVEELVQIEDIPDTVDDCVEYIYNNMNYKFDPRTNQDYIDDIFLGLIPQGNRTAYDAHIGVA